MTAAGNEARPVVVIGGAGFIGSNLARSVLADGYRVRVVDNLSRAGVERNLGWLRSLGNGRLEFIAADVTDAPAMHEAVAGALAVYNFAAQTAVTTSLDDPLGDFRTNALGTLNVLEAVRSHGSDTPVIFSSTNKVYGGLEALAMRETPEGYAPADPAIGAHGISESQPLDFCTPYGCSKGVADQYVLDYASSFGLPTAVLRMSCIYGPRQFGTEDQGWVAHFLIRALNGQPITIYGDGQQVRDILFVDDAVAAYRRLLADIERLRGRAFNLGGGPANTVSINTALAEIERLTGTPLEISRGDWRRGDQPYFVADTRALTRETGWSPQVGWRDGLARLMDWLVEGNIVRRPEPSRRRAVA
jgi:CDP-paratose 2-epimerase